MMKQIFILSLLFTAAPGFAETAEQYFDQANQAYQQGKFVDAIQKYEQIVQSGTTSGELLYNLGNAYYKAGNVSKAIVNYERALKLLPNDDDVRHNLQLANLMITDKTEPTPRLFVWDWWDAIKSSFTLNSITWLCYVFFVMMIGAIGLAMLAPSYAKRRAAFLGGLVCAAVLTFSGLIFVGKLNAVQSTDTAIVTITVTTVKNSPDANSTDAFVLHSGVKVLITDRVNEWFKIRLADGKVGWMEQKAGEII